METRIAARRVSLPACAVHADRSGTSERDLAANSNEILETSRAEFLNELFRRKISACQVTIDELREEISNF
ncbi:hypothetical protein NONS58_24640 [Nitrosococcus oceani]|nr:hypothetical protein NONS58_24640 [Nitrosococcus oceani]